MGYNTEGERGYLFTWWLFFWKIYRILWINALFRSFRIKLHDFNREEPYTDVKFTRNDVFSGNDPCWFGSCLNIMSVSSVAQSCLTLCDSMNRSTPGLPVHHQLLEFTQTHVHWVGDAIQPSHPLLSPFPPALNLSQHRGLFKWVSSSHQVAKVLELQLQHQSFQWTPRTDLL